MDDTFEVTITKSLSKNDVSFHEIRFSDRIDFCEITFRAYPKNVFVAIEDDRDNPSSGADLEDCYLVPPRVIQKTPKADFDPRAAFKKACEELYGEDSLVNYDGLYEDVEADVERWVKFWR